MNQQTSLYFWQGKSRIESPKLVIRPATHLVLGFSRHALQPVEVIVLIVGVEEGGVRDLPESHRLDFRTDARVLDRGVLVQERLPRAVLPAHL